MSDTLIRKNILVVFDAIHRQDTTGTHALRALRHMGHNACHYMPMLRQENSYVAKNYSDLPLDGMEFMLCVDDDFNYPVPQANLPGFYWCIDTHRMNALVGGGSRYDRIRQFDKVFLAQKDRADEVGGVWLPLAYDPRMYSSQPLTKTYDWSFIGNLSPKRIEFFNQLRSVFPNAFVGNAYTEEANRIYNQSRITLNLTYSNDVNMRFFESQATSAVLLSNRVNNGEEQLFSHVCWFDNFDDCVEQMRALLSNDELCQQVARSQSDEMAMHTYQARMTKLLAALEDRHSI